jgi:RNA polymerase primary sigma factor
MPAICRKTIFHNQIFAQALFSLWPSVAKFSRHLTISKTLVGKLLAGAKMAPFDQAGEYREPCLKIAEELGFTCEELFPPELYGTSNSKEILFSDLSAEALREIMKRSEQANDENWILVDVLDELLKITLSPIEQKVLCLRFGLNGESEHSFRKAGKQLNCTGSYVQQVEKVALQKLRRPSKIKVLLPFL